MRIPQGNFSAGILSEGMYSRADTAKFSQGLRDAVNMLVKPQGGIENRPGTSHLRPLPEDVFIHPFDYGDGVSFMLMFAPARSHITDTSAMAVGVSALPYATTFQPGAVKRGVTRMRIVDSPNEGQDVFDVGNEPAGAGSDITVADLHTFDNYLYFLGDPAHDINNRVFTVFGQLGHNFILPAGLTNAAVQGFSGDFHLVAPDLLPEEWTMARVKEASFAQDTSRLYMVHRDCPPVVIVPSPNPGYAQGVVAQEVDIDMDTRVKLSNNVKLDMLSYPAYLTATASTSINADVQITSTYAWSIVNRFGRESKKNGTEYSISNNTAYLGAYNTVEVVICRLPATMVSGSALTSAAAAALAAEDSNVPIRVNLYKQHGGIFGFVGYVELDRTDLLKDSVYLRATPNANTHDLIVKFVDNNITADTARGSVVSDVLAWPASDEPGHGEHYPHIAAFYEQRLVLASTKANPQAVYMSSVAELDDFYAHYPQRDTDALSFRIRSLRANAIKAIIPHRSLGFLTSEGVWELAAQGDGRYVRPSDRRLSPMNYRGSADLSVLPIGDVALFVEATGDRIRELDLVEKSRELGDLTILCRDLFRGRKIVDWAYTSTPTPVVWVVLDNGQLLTMTYERDHNIWAWTRHEFADSAVVEQVQVMQVGVADRVFLVVRRGEKRELLAMGDRKDLFNGKPEPDSDLDFRYGTFFDFSYVYELTGTAGGRLSYIKGLHGLAGKDVALIVNGNLIEGGVSVAPDGDLTSVEHFVFNEEGKLYITIGLPYTSSMTTLPVSFVNRDGTVDGRVKSVSRIVVRMERTRGGTIKVGKNPPARLNKWKPSFAKGPGDSSAIPPVSEITRLTVGSGWSIDPVLHIEQADGLPLTVNELAPDWEISDE